ncbi:MAG: hypothetical protein IPJ76_10720 [Flavobacteriales bacterium]|nr:MAG: hypothetical protein IPJ76_10720 [Flavobacteriales bacterium]
MLTIALLFVACGLFGLAFLLLLIFGLIKKRPFWILGAVAALVVAVGCGLSAVYLTAHKAAGAARGVAQDAQDVFHTTRAGMDKASEVVRGIPDAFKPRTGSEIYAAFFDETPACVTVTDHRDQVVPKIDTGISLRMKTCPREVQRILSMAPYTGTRSVSHAADRVYGGADAAGPFAPENLGDTITTYYWEVQPGRNWRWLYVDPDSTEAIMVDVLD